MSKFQVNVVLCWTLVSLFLLCTKTSSKVIYNNSGQLNIGFIIEECGDNITLVKKSLVHSAIWTVQRLNDLKLSGEYELGLNVQQACTEEEYLKAVFDLYQNNTKESVLLGILFDNDHHVPKVVPEFIELLKLDILIAKKYYQEEIKAAVKVLEVLGWMDDIEVIAPNQNVLKEFYRITRRDWMCVNRFHMHETFSFDSEENATHPIVFLGTSQEISLSLNKIVNSVTNNNVSNNELLNRILVVPFDGEQIPNLKETTLILQPTLAESDEPLAPPKILPSSLLFEVAAPIINLTQNLSKITEHCSKLNGTSTFSICVQTHMKLAEDRQPTLSQMAILERLKIESLNSEFIYNIQNVNSTMFTYSLFEENLTLINSLVEVQLKKRNISNSACFKEFDRCLLECENFKSFEVTKLFPMYTGPYSISLRPEPWVYAFFSLSILGIIFCLSIMCFIISRLCKKQVLEGNPILTILLLIDVILIFACVLPFAIEGNKSTRYEIYLIRALCVTLPYSFAFALLLSRTILLATVSREVGFMSHVAGSVQGFLTLFIFAVQCALSLQLTNSCNDVFHSGYSLISLMSYNAVLLILLTFITPLIAKSKRNYREGKYFTIGIIMLACSWSCWLPAYAVLDDAWRDPLLCLGLVSTGSILLGCVFIPRTYMMTVSAARERFTSALPSLATATSAMDIYRASTQPVYDCVNVAAIAAANLRAQHEHERRHQADFYSSPNDHDVDDEEDDDDEFVVQTCDSPPIDKVTRF